MKISSISNINQLHKENKNEMKQQYRTNEKLYIYILIFHLKQTSKCMPYNIPILNIHFSF